MEKGTAVYDEQLVEEEELWYDDDEAGRDGWWCVRTDPFPCPATGCTYVAEYMTAAHLILVWQENDDPNLLRHAARAREVGGTPASSGTSRTTARARRTTPGSPPGARCTAFAPSDASVPEPSRVGRSLA
jgi:hypothetical protein